MDKKQFIKRNGPKYLIAVILTDLGPWSVCSYSYYHEFEWVKCHPAVIILQNFTFNSNEDFNETKLKFSNYISRRIEWLEEKLSLKNSPKLAEAVLMGLVTRMALPPAFIKILVLAPYMTSLRFYFYLPVIISGYAITFYLAYDIVSRHMVTWHGYSNLNPKPKPAFGEHF